MWLSLIFIKAAGLVTATSFKRLHHRYFLWVLHHFWKHLFTEHHFPANASIIITWNTKLSTFLFFLTFQLLAIFAILFLLTYIIPTPNTHYTFRNSDKIPYFKTKHNFFKNSFFPSVVIEWNKLDPSLRRCDSYNVFKSNILKFIRPSSNSFFDCHNPIGIKYITRIRLGLSHLREHKFKHSFQDTLNPICNCGNDVESAIHFFLHCPLYSNERRTLLNSLVNIDHTLLDNTDFSLTQILLFGNTTFNAIENTKIINLTTDFVLSTKRFDEPLL